MCQVFLTQVSGKKENDKQTDATLIYLSYFFHSISTDIYFWGFFSYGYETSLYYML